MQESTGRRIARFVGLLVVAALSSDRGPGEGGIDGDAAHSPDRIRTEYFMGMNMMR